jgi:NAD(P)-dependent dehydrogenase (short-subunit alcohol dehydrogenase family)
MENNQLFNVKDKVALITGGSRGLGLMMAEALVTNGAHVIITSRDAETCEKAEKHLNSLSTRHEFTGTAVSIPADISKENGCIDVVKKIEELAKNDHRFQQGLHILINNAGATWGAPLAQYPDKAWDKVLELNVKSVFNMTKHALPLLKKAATKQEPASVINLGSISGLLVPNLEIYAYTTSKAAVHHLTKHLADRLARDHIRVNCVAPGFIPTKMSKGTLDAVGQRILDGTPLKRFGNEQDIAGVTLFLSSKASSWMTGAVMPLDGGGSIASHL